MIIIEDVSIGVAKEGEIYRAYAYNSKTEENIAICKCDRRYGAISGLFEELRKIVILKDTENESI